MDAVGSQALLWAIVVGIALLVFWPYQRSRDRAERHGDGALLRDTTLEHRCHPPGASEWPAGRWKVDRTRRYPEGTVWRCSCGQAWVSSKYHPSGIARWSDSGGLWLNWYELREDQLEALLRTPDDG